MTTTIEETVAQRVLRIRTSLGLRQIDLARLLGVSERTVIRWESGSLVRRIYLDRLGDMLAAKEAGENGATAEQP